MGTLQLFAQQQTIAFAPQSNGATFNTCNGFLIDSGGQGGSGYGNGENFTITFCPDTPGDVVNVVFNLFNLSLVDDNPAPNITNVDVMQVFDGNSVNGTFMGSYTGTSLQGVVIQPTELNNTGCLTFVFTSNTAGTGFIGGSVTCKTPCINPVAMAHIIGGVAPDSIRVCIGEPVVFADNGSHGFSNFNVISYEWDFMDGSSAVGTTATHSYDAPGYYLVQLKVQDSNTDTACFNNNFTSLRVLVATEPDFSPLPTFMEICIGESAGIVANPDDYEVEWNGFPSSTTIDNGCITDDLLGVQQQVPLAQTGFESTAIINSATDIVSMCFDMEHSFIGDLLITLTCPTGQNIILHQQGGGGVNLGIPNQADNVDCDIPNTMGQPSTYCFAPSATQTFVQAIQGGGNVVGNSLNAGNYSPVGPWNNLIGCPANGTWTLNVTDLWGADDGTVFGFSMSLNPDFYPDEIAFKPENGHSADSSYWQAGSAGLNATFSNNMNTIQMTPTTAGTYFVQYVMFNDFGCPDTHVVEVYVPELIYPNAGQDIIVCENNPAQLDGGLNGSGGACNFTLVMLDSAWDGWHGNNLSLNNGGTITTHTVPSGNQNTHQFSVINGQSFTLTFNSLGPWVNECSYRILDGDGNIIYQSSGSLSGHNVTHTFTCAPLYSFVWSPPTNLNNANIEDPIWTGATNQTMILTAFPVGHPACVTTDTMQITVIPPPYAGADAQISICSQDPPIDLFNLLGPNALTGGTWRNNMGQVINMPFNPASMPSGAYRYRVGGNACIDEATVTVIVTNTAITFHQVDNVTCNSGNDGRLIFAGTGIFSYSLNGGPTTPIAAPFILNDLEAGDYHLQVFSLGTCSAEIDFSITEPEPLSIPVISPDTTICREGTAVIFATAAGGSSDYIYTWTYNGQVVSDSATFEVTPGQGQHQYCLTLSEVCGSPVATSCTNVFIEQELVPALSPDFFEGCEAHDVIFENVTNGPITSAYIIFGDGKPDTLIQGNGSFAHTYDYSGSYHVQMDIISQAGCFYTHTFQNMIVVHPTPEASFYVSPSHVSMFSPHVNFVDGSTGNIATYTWSMPFGTPSSGFGERISTTYPLGDTGTYYVTLYVETEHGCVDSIVREVFVIEDVILFAPNTFTPNGDGFNQTWRVHFQGIDDHSFELMIFDRWGEMVLHSFDEEQGWDGSYKGQIVQGGTYSYVINARELNTDKKFTFNGFINVLK